MYTFDCFIDAQNIKRLSGIYRGDNNKEKFYFFQDHNLDPSIFPPTRYNDDDWKKIKRIYREQLEEYIRRIEIQQICQRSVKKRKLDDVDIIIRNQKDTSLLNS